VLIVLKSGSLNLLEPSEPVQACNGIAESIFKIEEAEPLSFISMETSFVM
jgi:hypothetical protein